MIGKAVFYVAVALSVMIPLATHAESAHMVIGHVDRVIDGNTVIIDETRIRIPLVDVLDSGNKTAPHAKLAQATCPANAPAYYVIDNLQPVDRYGRTIAMVFCDGSYQSLGQTMISQDLGWINTYYCDKSEFAPLWDECM